MINVRAGLFGALRSFIEQQACGLVTWNGVKVLPGIPAEPLPNGRRNPHGRFKEIATIEFGDYELTASSPDADPPLGWIALEWDGGKYEGPLDQTVFDEMGKIIRQRGIRVFDHGNRQRSEVSGDQWGRSG